MKRPVLHDERVALVDGQVTTVALAITQAAMALVVAYKRYVLHLAPEYYQAFSYIVIGSFILTGAAKLSLRGAMPRLTAGRAVLIWLAAMLVISVPSALIHGLPTAANWTSTILPAAAGPAVVIGIYWLLANWSERRMRAYLEE